MRKRSKKRIPQDIKPWAGVKDAEEDSLSLPAKKVSRWVAGSRRDWNTRILVKATASEVRRVFHTAVFKQLPKSTENFLQQSAAHRRGTSKLTALGKYKNFCLYSGRGRTYSRNLYVARHNLRRLVSTGLVSGLIK